MKFSILETALYVQNLDQSESFYADLFGFKTLLSDERMRALQVAESPTQILLLFKVSGSKTGEETDGGFIPGHDGRGILHLCFAIEWETQDFWRGLLTSKNIPIESEVRANQGYSLYFRDPDGHCIELGVSGLWDIEKRLSPSEKTDPE